MLKENQKQKKKDMEEIWKYYDETHKVSNLGRVMWFDGIDWKFNKIHHGKGGHPSISIYHQPKPIKRLVAQLFVDNPNGMPCVVNIDGDKNNCTAANLKWVSVNELGSYQGDNSLQYEDVVKRIKEAKGDTYQMVGEFKKLCEPTRFRCSKCGNEFDGTPQHIIVLKEPCPHCRKKEVEQRRETRQREIEQEKANRMENLPNLHEHVVYAYIFDDGHAYVGLTCNQRQRDSSHRCDDSSAVYLHSKETGAAIPNMTILEQGLTPKEAQHYESLWLKWMSNTFTMLNRMPTGGLGGLFGNVPHTLENALKAKEKFKTRKALRWHCKWAWELLKDHGKLPNENYWQRYVHKKKHKKNLKQLTIGF